MLVIDHNLFPVYSLLKAFKPFLVTEAVIGLTLFYELFGIL